MPRDSCAHADLAPGLTQKEVAELLGISRGRVHQIEQQAILKLRRHPIIRALAEEYGIPLSEFRIPS